MLEHESNLDGESKLDREPNVKRGSKLDRESKLDRAKEGVSAGAEQVRQISTKVANTTREKASQAARIVREAEPDNELQATVRDRTERGLQSAGDRVSGAAPAVGRGAEYAVEKVGAALRFVGRPLAMVLAPIAGTVGGWWKKAAELKAALPSSIERECRDHFSTVLVVDGMTYDHAHTGYVLGYLAGGNPDYQNRSFEEIEPDLQHGFPDAESEYQALREFARFGYEKSRGGAIGQL